MGCVTSPPFVTLRRCLVLILIVFPYTCATSSEKNTTLVKIGGSSITDKANRETLRQEALEWLSATLALALNDTQPESKTTCSSSSSSSSSNIVHRRRRIVLVHGAGSFGHHSAKEFGLEGKNLPPFDETTGWNETEHARLMKGVAQTRLSVQTLNRQVVANLIKHGLPAVGISPCLNVPQMQAHGGDEGMAHLATIVEDALQAGLLPVIHGDACLYGQDSAGILGGDTLMEALGLGLPHIARAVFITDVDGVFTADPRSDPKAELLPLIEIDSATGKILTEVSASGSSHVHDVTGGLKAKLGAAASIAASGTDVIIAKCESEASERAILGDEKVGRATLIRGTTAR